ncbi:MAG TPA: hypothetical protein V6C97_21670 [Oculatellaceae cyanobacterium]
MDKGQLLSTSGMDIVASTYSGKIVVFAQDEDAMRIQASVPGGISAAAAAATPEVLHWIGLDWIGFDVSRSRFLLFVASVVHRCVVLDWIGLNS